MCRDGKKTYVITYGYVSLSFIIIPLICFTVTTPAIKAFRICIALMALNQFCGCFAMLNYTATIFAESGSNLSPNMSAIVIGVIQIIGSYISTMLVDRAGRKVKYLIDISI